MGGGDGFQKVGVALLMRVCVIIPAAGASGRYLESGGLRSKLDEELGGKPVLQRTVEAFSKFEDPDVTVCGIVVAGPHEDGAFREFKERHGDRLGLLGATVCKGGVTHRWETVRAALACVPADATHVAVHDGARPCVSEELMRRVFAAGGRFEAVVPVLAVHDTVKRVKETGEKFGGDDAVAAILGESESAKKPLRVVDQTVDRAGLVLVQTPQVFEVGVLKRAYEQKDLGSTDDAGLVERLGVRVVVVEGDARNLKITLPGDIAMARAVMGLKEPEGRAAHKKF